MKRSETKLTERFVNTLKPPAEGQKFYWDGETRGFGIAITAGGTRTYVVQKRVNGKTVRMKIGVHGVWNPEQARGEARGKLRAMEKGEDPREEKRAAESAGLTLRALMLDYCEHKRTRSGLPLKARTKADIERHVIKSFAAWTDKPVANITPDACLKRFREMSVTGPVSANQGLRVLRGLLNYARESNETAEGVATLLPINPVNRVKKFWNAEKVRDGRVPTELIGVVWNWLQEQRVNARTLDDRASVDVVCLMLLTGARVGEMTSLMWENVKLEDDSGSFHLHDTKNRRSVTFPLSTPARKILKERLALLSEDNPTRERRAKRERPLASVYVFPSWGAAGHITEVRATMTGITALCKTLIRSHDLRRTFADVTEEVGIPASKLKQLINHISADVTGRHYTNNRDLRKLASAAESVGAWIVEQGVIAASKNVIALRA